MSHYPLLDQINHPADMRALGKERYKELAEEMRKRIIDVLSVNGGHLGSNLGIIELSIALHDVFESPKDKLIFDTSHQSYPHKLLTGRHRNFESIRKDNGLCGFTHPEESPFDHFYAGHAGTALSLGLGMAMAREQTKQDFHVVSVLGDADLSCGLTLEAINNLPDRLPRFTTILNDNDMFIYYSTGRYREILAEIRSGGRRSGEMFFGKLGFDYVGVVDGHDTQAVIEALEDSKTKERPAIVHVKTVKGQGLSHAIENPVKFHGVSPFNQETGVFHKKPTKSTTFPKVFGEQIIKMAEKHPNLLAVTPATPAGACLTEMMQKFPERTFDVGIAEGHAVTFAAGLAATRDCPVFCSVYATFFQRALDNIFQDVCLQKIPVIFTLDRAGLSPADGSTHHGIFDIGFLHSMPGMVLAQPRDGQVLAELLESAPSYRAPTAIRYPNRATCGPKEPLVYRKPGEGEVVQEGSEIAIVALGHMHALACEVSETLEKVGIQPTIVDPVFIKPLDCELFENVANSHSLIVTIEEHALTSGLASILNSFIVKQNGQRPQMLNFGIPDKFIDHGSYDGLCEEIGLNAKTIADQILSALKQHIG